MSIRYYERIGKNSGVSMPLWLAFIVYTFAFAVVAVALLALAAVWALWLLVVLGEAGWSRHKRRPRRLRVDPTAVEEPQRFIDTGERQRSGASEHRRRHEMRRPAIVCVLTCVAFVAAGAARAAASTLNLSVSPYTDSSGNSAATITASGNTGADPYGEGWELDVFAAPGAATCATTAESEDANLGFPSFGTASYPGFANVTGPFSQNFTLDPGTSTGGTYTVCAYLSYADEFGQTYATAQTTAVLPAAAPPSTQPCPTGTSPELSFSAPSVVVYGRQGHVSVNSTAYGGNPTNAVLTMQAIGSTQPFYAHAFTSNELNNLEAENTLTFFIEFSRGAGPAVVTLAYDESVLTTTLSSAVCTMSKSVQVSPIVGAVPTARFTDGPSDASILFAAPGGCSKTRIVPATVTVTGHGAHMRATTADACSGHWTRRGSIPGVSVGWSANSSRGEFVFAPSGSNEFYQVTVRVKGHVAKRGSLNAVYSFVPSKRIWEGTDAFINYCIDGNHTVYSLHHKLYCWDLGSTLAYVNLSTN